jgi:hypothetical protein
MLKKTLLIITILHCVLHAAPVIIDSNVNMFSGPNIFPNSVRSLDGGHKLARSARALHSVFVHKDNSTYTLVYSQSDNNGATWQYKNLVTTTNSTFIPIVNPSIAVLNNKLYVVYAEQFALKLIVFDDAVVNNIVANTYSVDSGGKYYHLYTDIAFNNNNIYIAAIFDVDRYRVRFFHADINNLSSWTEEKAPSNKSDSNDFDYFTPLTDYSVPTIAMRVNLAVSPVDQDVVLAFDYAQVDNSTYDTLISNAASRVAIHKYDSSSGFPIASSPLYIDSAQYGNAAYDTDGNLHVVYTADPLSGTNTLGYKKYDADLNLISTTGFPAITAQKIYSPHIGFTTANIPVIQFVSSNGTSYEILQISQRAPAVWTTGSLIKNVSSPANPAVFSHMVADVRDDRPDMLWWNTNNGSSGAVYYNRPDDYIAPWIPDTPSLQWIDKGLNSGDTQGITVNANSWTARADHANPIQYAINGSRGTNYNIGWSTFSTNHAVQNIGDRQTVSASIRAQDAVGNMSEWSPTVSIYLADRTSPAGSVVINSGDPLYTNNVNVNLQLSYNDNVPGPDGQSGVNKVIVGGDVTVFGDSTLVNTVVAANGTLSKILTAANGQKTVTVSYADVSGNTSAVYQDTIHLDTVTPSITSAGESRNSNQPDPVAVSWTAADPLSNNYASGVSTYNIYWGDDALAVAGSETPTTSAKFDPPSVSTEKTYYLRVQPVDMAGNAGNWVTVLTYVYNTTAPSDAGVTINNGAEYTNDQNVLLTLKATNAVSMNISNSSGYPSGGWIDYQEYNNNYPWMLTSGDGPKTIYVWYKSSNGSDTPVQDSITLDATVPTFPDKDTPDPSNASNYFGVLINGGAVWTNTLNASLNLSATSGTAPIVSINISNDNSTWSGWQEYVTVTHNWLLTSGGVTKTVYVRFRDAAGNTSAVVTDDILFDAVPPDPGLVAPGNGASNYGVLINNGDAFTNSQTVALSLNAVSTGSAVVSMNISNDIDFSTNSSWIAYNTNHASWQLSAGQGTKTVYALFRDAAGNISATVNDTIVFTTQALPQPIGGGITINNGAEWTNTLNVSLNIGALNAVSFNISNYDTFPDNQYSSGTLNYVDHGSLDTAFDYGSWLLLSGNDGVRTVYVKFIDQYGRSIIVQDTIKLDTTPPAPGLIDPGNGFSNYGVLINNGQPKTFSPTVNLTLSANPVADVAEIWLSNSPDFTNKIELHVFQPSYSNWNLGGTGDRYVYVKFIDAAGNSVNVQDDILVDTNLILLDFIEPDGVNDVASNNFTLSWIDYPQLLNDPAATITLWAEEANNSSWHKISENISFSDPVNGVIWDTSALNNGTYNISAAIDSIFGAVTVNAPHPVYVVHSDNNGDVGPYPPGPLPSDPPTVLVIEPSRDVQAGQAVHIVWENKNTAGDGSLITIYYDTDTDPTNGRTMITANIDADDPADFYDWLADKAPQGEYYICVEISNNAHVNYDYSSGKVIVPKPAEINSSTGSGGADEPIYSYPNPVSPKKGETAHIVYRVDKDGWTKVYIYNIRGQRIWQTDRFARGGESTEVLWDGRDTRGAIAPNGIYILMLVNEKKHIIAKGRLTIYD